MPTESSNVTPISTLPWSEPLGRFLLRAAKSTLAANCFGLATFGVVYALWGDQWAATGSMLIVVPAAATLALVPSFHLGWKRFTAYWLVCAGSSVAVLGLAFWTIFLVF